MPPKKSAKKKGGKKKKGAKDDRDSAFEDFLNDMFFVSQTERDKMREMNRKRVRAAFTFFQGDREGRADIRELGCFIRHLGLNPTVAQLQIIQPLVEDAETGSFIEFSKLEPLLLDMMQTKELRFSVTNADGTTAMQSTTIAREPEEVVQRVFDTLWDATGKDVDAGEQAKYLKGEELRAELTRVGGVEAFDDNEATEFLHAVSDPDSGQIKEDLFTLSCLE